MRSAGPCCLALLLCGLSLVARAEDIAVSGFNEDVVTESGGGVGHRFDNYLTNPADWAEDGLTSRNTVGVGLPGSRTFVSGTSSGVTYHLRPYDGNNVLRMGDDDPASGTMVVSPGRYQSVHVLAASAMGGAGLPTVLGQTSDIVLNFSDGQVVLPRALLAYDWYVPYSDAPAGVIALGGLNRNFIGPQQSSSGLVDLDTTNGRNFALYETALDLKSLSLSTRVLQSITFHDVNDAHSIAGVFAVDGKRIPSADLNGDGIVNFQDLLILAQHYGRTPAAYTDGDVNGDGTVTFADLLLLAQDYGAGSAGAAPVPAPEPAAAAVLLVATPAFLRRRK